jgi:hypothetical protein
LAELQGNPKSYILNLDKNVLSTYDFILTKEISYILLYKEFYTGGTIKTKFYFLVFLSVKI